VGGANARFYGTDDQDLETTMAETSPEQLNKDTNWKGVVGVAATLVGAVGVWVIGFSDMPGAWAYGFACLALTPAGIVMGARMLKDIRQGAPTSRRWAITAIVVGVIGTAVFPISLIVAYIYIANYEVCGGC
jgi:hypothetical protein